MTECKGSADRSAEEEWRSPGWRGAFLAPCEERRMTCFPFEVLSVWGRAMPSWPGWKDAWEGECVATALCGVTDGDSEWQTWLSERGEEDILVLQTPAPRHDSGTGAMHCPSSFSYSHHHQEEHELVIWSGGFLIHHPVVFLDVLQGETQLKNGPKRAGQAYLKSALCSEVWKEGSKRVENILWSHPVLLLDGWKTSSLKNKWHIKKVLFFFHNYTIQNNMYSI